MFYKLIFLTLLLVGVVLCSPRPNNATPAEDPQNKTTVDKTTKIPLKTMTSKDKVQLTVYYETFCYFSVEFFSEQLQPAVLKLGSYLDLQLVPYGKAETSNETDSSGRYNFTCQHGENECLGNLVHACVIDVLSNNTQAVLLNNCLMESSFDYKDSKELITCGETEKISTKSVDDIKACVNGTRGTTLLKSYGELTKANKVKYVPHLTFDGSSQLEHDGKANLTATICNMLNPQPQACLSSN